MSVLRNRIELLILDITDTDKRFGESETIDHIQVLEVEFPKSASALENALPLWLEELRQHLDSAPAATTIADMPVFEAFCKAVVKINWQALLIVECSYPEILIVELQDEYAAYIRQEYLIISESRTGAQSAYENMLNALREIALDQYLGLLTTEEADEKASAAFKLGEAILVDYLT